MPRDWAHGLVPSKDGPELVLEFVPFVSLQYLVVVVGSGDSRAVGMPMHNARELMAVSTVSDNPHERRRSIQDHDRTHHLPQAIQKQHAQCSGGHQRVYRRAAILPDQSFREAPQASRVTVKPHKHVLRVRSQYPQSCLLLQVPMDMLQLVATQGSISVSEDSTCGICAVKDACLSLLSLEWSRLTN